MPADGTRRRFLTIGRREFLEKGYPNVSLRGVVREAGFTLGAFYRHFPNKEALFEALVKEDADGLLQRYTSAHQTFASLPPDEQIADMASVAGGGFGEMIGYMLDRFDSFKLIFCRSEGTAYARFLDGLIEGEVQATHRFIDTLNRNGHPVPDIDYALVHILATAIFRGVVEIFEHDMSVESALHYAEQLREFYTAGWERLLGL